MKTKAAIVERFNYPLSVEELEVPALKHGQVLVRVYASGVCGAQLNHIAGTGLREEFLPFLLGHEGGGEVIDIGSSVKSVKAGDRVVLHWRPGAGIESEFPKYTRSDGSTVGAGLVTTFNSVAVVSENRVTKIGNDIPYEIAALMGCCVTTGLGLINNEACLKIGESIVVFGCGGVGLSIIQGAKMVSGNPIVGVDISDDKLKLAKAFGATHIINTKYSLNIGKQIQARIGFGKSDCADVCVDTTGNTKCIESAYNLAKRNGGRVIMVGQPKPGQDIVFHDAVKNFNGKILMDSTGGQTDPAADIPRYVDLYKAGIFNPEKLICLNEGNFYFQLSEINGVISRLRSGQILGRAIIRMDDEQP